MSTKKERVVVETLKAKFRREMADFKLNAGSLLEIFGMAFRAKISEPSNPHNSIGSNYFNAHGKNHQERGKSHNPPGTKLVRRFIRHSKKEQVGYRKLYAELTGHQYQRESEA